MKRWRRFLAAAGALALLAIGVRLWFIEGLLRRITIDGPSMAPAFCGAHYDLTCQDCSFPFRIDAESPPKNGEAACPNCGFTENKLSDAALRPADRVVIDRWPLLWRKPQVGEIVAARLPDESSSLVVKRIAAIELKTLSIENGDLFVDGKLQRKSLVELRAVRVLVHDNDFQPRQSTSLPPRWRPAQEGSRWKAAGGGFQFYPSTSVNSDLDWLEYQHWPCTSDPRLRGTTAPVRDNDSYNQGPGPRELNAVPDVLISCRVRWSDCKAIRFIARDGEQRFEIAFESNELLAHRDEHSGRLRFPIMNLSPTGSHVEFGLCDQQLLLAIDGRTLVCQPYDRPVGPLAETLRPLVIIASGLSAEIAELRVWRDIYHLDPQGLSRHWESEPSPPNRIALLGDNPPVSIDSRHWQPNFLALDSMLGIVRRPFWLRDPK